MRVCMCSWFWVPTLQPIHRSRTTYREGSVLSFCHVLPSDGTWGNQAPWQPLLPAEQSGWPRTIFIDGAWTQWVLLSAEGPEMDFAWVRKDSCTTELGMYRFCLLTWGVLIYATLILAFLVFLEQTSPRTLGIIVLAKACVRRWSTHGLARATTECTLSKRTSPYL